MELKENVEVFHIDSNMLSTQSEAHLIFSPKEKPITVDELGITAHNRMARMRLREWSLIATRFGLVWIAYKIAISDVRDGK